MKLRKVVKEDLLSINSWYVKRSLPALSADILPEIGLIAPGVAALFIYQTDSSMAMIEGLIANPDATARDRAEAINQLIDTCVDYAHLLGYTQVIGLTRDAGTYKRVKRHGFFDLGTYQMVAKRT